MDEIRADAELEPGPAAAPIRLRRLLVAAVAVLVAAALAAAILVGDRPSPIARAQEMVAEDRNFATATSTGVTFIRIATLLREAAESCADDDGLDDPRCEALFSASAYAQITAVQVLPCTRPGVFTAREHLRGYLTALRAGKTPDPPPPTVC